MREIPASPGTFSYLAICALRADGGLHTVYRTSTITEFLSDNKYRRDYSLGDVIALVLINKIPTRFSHWSIPSGGDARDAEGIWSYATEHQVIRRWSVRHGGKLVELEGAPDA